MDAQLSLSRAALRLSLTYHQVRAMLLRGDLQGGQDENGRYFVYAEAVEWTLDNLPLEFRERRSGGRR